MSKAGEDAGAPDNGKGGRIEDPTPPDRFAAQQHVEASPSPFIPLPLGEGNGRQRCGFTQALPRRRPAILLAENLT
jgi:hypothetical protein